MLPHDTFSGLGGVAQFQPSIEATIENFDLFETPI
jgi:hypothetical protein